MFAALSVILSAQQAAAPPPPPPPCASEAHGAFDFWVGEWDVWPNQEGAAKVADSRIEKLFNGCGIRETWLPLKGSTGGSLTALESDGVWRQHWVGGGGAIVEFAGGAPNDGEMVLTGYWRNAAGPGTNPMVRMHYTLREDGSVRQHGEQSLDHGLTWSDSFDLIYRRKQ